jgi:hypothetical protein
MVKRSPFPHVKGEIGGLVDNLFGLPYSSVWIHEMQLFYLIKVRARKNYGKRDVLSLMLDGIRKGYCGNKQKNDFVLFPYIAANLSEEQNQHNITVIQILW